MRIRMTLGFSLLATSLLTLGTAAVFAQSSQANGKLKINVSPKQAYVFVDGKAIRDGSQTIALSAGNHAVGVDNYGYIPQIEERRYHRRKDHGFGRRPASLRQKGERAVRRHRTQGTSARRGSAERHDAGILRRPRR